MNNLKQVQPSEPVESESFIRIKLRGKNNEDTNMRVKQVTITVLCGTKNKNIKK